MTEKKQLTGFNSQKVSPANLYSMVSVCCPRHAVNMDNWV